MRRVVFGVAALLSTLALAHAALAATVTVRSGSYYYEDATVGDGRIVARVGDRLHVLTEDAGKGTPHTVEVDELGIHSGSLGTSSTYTTPVLSRAGTFLMYCKPHRNKGHYTDLVVLGDATPAPTAAPTPVPTPAATASSGATASPTSGSVQRTPAPPASSLTPVPTQSGSAALGSSATPDPTPASTLVAAASTAPEHEGTVAISSPGEGIRTNSTTWLRSVLVGLLALIPLAVVTGLAGWMSSRRRS